MPNTSNTHQTRSHGDDLGSTDEVKVFKDEGDKEDETVSSENLLEEKSSLIDLTESEEKSGVVPSQSDHDPVFNKNEPHASNYNMEYLFTPYSRVNGAGHSFPISMTNKIGLQCFFSSNNDNLTTPPPAHCGIPPYQMSPKIMGITRAPLYPFSSSQYPYAVLSPEMQQVASWHASSVYSSSAGLRNTYHLPLSNDMTSDFPFRFSSNILPSVHPSPYHMINNHSATVTKEQCDEDGIYSHFECKNMKTNQANEKKNIASDKKKPHIKKPLNAFMLYMKEMRAKVVAECTLKESAAINQILGRRWHELSREEQSKYYEKARQERQLHMELYPGWSARDNYGYVSKKRKRKKNKQSTDSEKLHITKC